MPVKVFVVVSYDRYYPENTEVQTVFKDKEQAQKFGENVLDCFTIVETWLFE